MASSISPPADTPSSRDAAPGALELVRQFVNSRDLETDEEDFTDLNALRRWFVIRRLLTARERLVDGDLERALTVREALRDVLVAHHGDAPDAGALKVVNAAAATAPVTVVLERDGDAQLRAGAPGLDAALGRLFAIIERASVEGTWRRLKVCPADDCRCAFYDHSRNRSGTWCSMAVCGNRSKARAFRQRRSGA